MKYYYKIGKEPYELDFKSEIGPVPYEARELPTHAQERRELYIAFDIARRHLRRRSETLSHLANQANEAIQVAHHRILAEGGKPTGLTIGHWWWAAITLQLEEINNLRGSPRLSCECPSIEACEYQGLPVTVIIGAGAIVT